MTQKKINKNAVYAVLDALESRYKEWLSKNPKKETDPPQVVDIRKIMNSTHAKTVEYIKGMLLKDEF